MADRHRLLTRDIGIDRKPVRPLARGKQQVQLGVLCALRL
jgi:hypothetical protein